MLHPLMPPGQRARFPWSTPTMMPVTFAGGGHWVTLQGEDEGGGVHLFVGGGGTITKGPSTLVGQNITHLSSHPMTHHPEGHTPAGATSHPSYTEAKDKAPEKATGKDKTTDEGTALKGRGKPYAREQGADQGKEKSTKASAGKSQDDTKPTAGVEQSKERAEAGLETARDQVRAKQVATGATGDAQAKADTESNAVTSLPPQSKVDVDLRAMRAPVPESHDHLAHLDQERADAEHRLGQLKAVRDTIKGMGGIRPDRDVAGIDKGQQGHYAGTRASQEYQDIPSHFKNQTARHTIDTMAQELHAHHPALGIDGDADRLREYLHAHEAERQDLEARVVDLKKRGASSSAAGGRGASEGELMRYAQDQRARRAADPEEEFMPEFEGDVGFKADVTFSATDATTTADGKDLILKGLLFKAGRSGNGQEDTLAVDVTFTDDGATVRGPLYAL